MQLGWGTALLALGSLGLGAFVWWEKARAEHPVLHMALFFQNRVFAVSNLAAFINYSSTSAVVFLLSLYLQYVKGLTPSAAGLVMVSQPIVMAVLSPVVGRLSDRIEGRWLASAGMTLTVTGLISLSFLSSRTSVTVVLFALNQSRDARSLGNPEALSEARSRGVRIPRCPAPAASIAD